jgi:hypothetical protein
VAWQTIVHPCRGNRGNYCILPGSSARYADSGWDTATLNIAQNGIDTCYFTKGSPHPDLSGLFATEVNSEGAWHGDIYLFTIQFAGLAGGVQGTVTRQETVGAQRTERTITAVDYFESIGGGTGYGGTTERPLFKVPGVGGVDVLRFISLQPYSEKQFITTYAPPTQWSLQALSAGATILTVAPPSRLDQATGTAAVANLPNGMLASSVRYTKHPAPGVNIWILDIRWESVAPYDLA